MTTHNATDSGDPSDLSPVLMWIAITAVIMFCVFGGAALIGWLPMTGASQMSEETNPAPQRGKVKRANAIAFDVSNPIQLNAFKRAIA